MRLLEVVDPDGNRIELGQDVSAQMIREGGQQDVRFLRDMLRHAYYWRSRDTEFPITRYVNAWGARATARSSPRRLPRGRRRLVPLYSEDEPGFGFVDAETPELTIGVVPSRRGRGSARASSTPSSTGPEGPLRADQPLGREDEPRGAPLREPWGSGRSRGTATS